LPSFHCLNLGGSVLPKYAHLDHPLKCPACNNILSNLAQFQWGYCDSSVKPYLTYRMGDGIQWRICKDQKIYSWTYFPDGSANIGDPSISYIIQTDYAFSSICCKFCGHKLGGVAVKIDLQKIVDAWIYSFGDFSEEAYDYLRDNEGTLRGVKEWVDKPMNHVKECSDDICLVCFLAKRKESLNYGRNEDQE